MFETFKQWIVEGNSYNGRGYRNSLFRLQSNRWERKLLKIRNRLETYICNIACENRNLDCIVICIKLALYCILQNLCRKYFHV